MSKAVRTKLSKRIMMSKVGRCVIERGWSVSWLEEDKDRQRGLAGLETWRISFKYVPLVRVWTHN